MKELIAHTRWMTALAAGLATATVTLPPIADSPVAMGSLGVVAFVLLGLSAWCGTTAAKLYVAYLLASDGPPEAFDPDDAHAIQKAQSALNRGRVWALIQQLLFALGGVLAGVFLIANLL